MGLIKRQFAEPVLKDAIVLDLGDITRQAQQIREAAEQRALQIVDEARKAADEEATRAHNDASEKGYEQGVRNGVEQGKCLGRDEALKESRERLERIESAWTEAVGAWDDHRDGVEREAQQVVLRLALGLGEKIVRRAIQVDHEVVLRQVGDALSHVLRPVDVTVRICPEDRGLLEDAMPKLAAQFAHLTRIQLVDDESVTPGGCVVVYGQGRIDATIETQLDRMVRMLMPEGGKELLGGGDDGSE